MINIPYQLKFISKNGNNKFSYVLNLTKVFIRNFLEAAVNDCDCPYI